MIDITKAIIAGIATIISALLTLLLKEYFDKKKAGKSYEKIGKEIRDAVSGKWKGQFEQLVGNRMEPIELQIELKVTDTGAINGKAKFFHDGKMFDINVKGDFYSERFLKMDYENASKAILQFGAFVFKLSGDSETLTGCFVGYGHKSGVVVGGNAALNKV